MEWKCSRAELSFFTLMPNSLSSITTISRASMESSPRPPANSGSSSGMSSGVMSSNLSRSISSSLSFRLRSFMGQGSFSHNCGGRRQRVPRDARSDRPALLYRHDEKEEREPHAIERRRQYVSAEDADDREKERARRVGAEENLQELALVEVRDEAEVAVDRHLAVARVALKQLHRSALELLHDRIRRALARLHRQQHAGGENGIEKSGGVSGHDEVLAGHTLHAIRKIAADFDLHDPLALLHPLGDERRGGDGLLEQRARLETAAEEVL